jgi:hypothetical protein
MRCITTIAKEVGDSRSTRISALWHAEQHAAWTKVASLCRIPDRGAVPLREALQRGRPELSAERSQDAPLIQLCQEASGNEQSACRRHPPVIERDGRRRGQPPAGGMNAATPRGGGASRPSYQGAGVPDRTRARPRLLPPPFQASGARRRRHRDGAACGRFRGSSLPRRTRRRPTG